MTAENGCTHPKNYLNPRIDNPLIMFDIMVIDFCAIIVYKMKEQHHNNVGQLEFVGRILKELVQRLYRINPIRITNTECRKVSNLDEAESPRWTYPADRGNRGKIELRYQDIIGYTFWKLWYKLVQVMVQLLVKNSAGKVKFVGFAGTGETFPWHP